MRTNSVMLLVSLPLGLALPLPTHTPSHPHHRLDPNNLPNDPQELLKLCNALPEDKETTASTVICNDLRTALGVSTNPYPPARAISVDTAAPEHDRRDVRPEQVGPAVVQDVQRKAREKIADQLYRIVQFFDTENDRVTMTAKSQGQPSTRREVGDGLATSPASGRPVQQASGTIPRSNALPAGHQGVNDVPALPLTPRDGLDGLENAIEAKVTGNIAHNGEHIANVVDSTLPVFGPGLFGPGGPFDSISGKPLKITP